MALEIQMPQLDDEAKQGTLLKWRVKEGDLVHTGDPVAEVSVGVKQAVLRASTTGFITRMAVSVGAVVEIGGILAVLTPLAQDEGESEIDGSGCGSVSSAARKSVRIRRIIARKMEESWRTIPHFHVTMAVNMTDVIRFRKDLGVTINDFILAAVGRSLREHPWVNSHWVDGEAVEQPKINIAMAVATEHGLFYPVLHACGCRSLKEIGQRAALLADKAHRGLLNNEDTEGGTFTVSNMGMLGVESFRAIITPPQAAVLAVGTVKGEVVVEDDGEPGIAPMLRLNLAADHRILDGADAAEFLYTLKSYLEAPVTLITCDDEGGGL